MNEFSNITHNGTGTKGPDGPHRGMRVLLSTSMSKAGFFISPPLGLVRLQYYLQERGIHCDLLDLDLNNQPDYLGNAKQGFYDVIGISVSHYNVECDLDMLWDIRNSLSKSDRRCVIVGGGQEATMNYDQWLDMGCDIILTGFAEKRLFSLCCQLGAHKSAPLWKLAEGIDGVVVRNGEGKTIFVENGPLTVEEFHELSYDQVRRLHMPYEPYWTQVREEIGSTNFHKNKFTVECSRLFTSSHCPRGCGFCSSQSFVPASQKKKSPIIMLTADQVHDLIVHYAQDYGAKSFLFSDDDYLVGSRAGLERAEEICRKVIASKAKGEIPQDAHFSCQTRIVNFLKRKDGVPSPNWDFLKLMHDAGFHSIGLGVETFSDRLLRMPSVNKVGVERKDIDIALEAMLVAGLLPQINLILAVPESTVDELMHSMRVGAEYISKGCQVAVTSLMKAIPGAPMLLSGDYKHTTIDWKNPITEKEVKIAHYFEPNDSQIHDIVHSIESSSLEELAKWKENSPWKGGTTPKFLFGLATFIAVSELLNKKDDANYFRKVTSEIINDVNTLAVV